MRPIQTFNLIFSLLGGLVLLIIIAPLVGLLLTTSSVNLLETTMDFEVQKSIFLSLGTSSLATFVLAFFAIPLSYLIARRKFKGRRILISIIEFPIIIPHTAAGIALLSIVSGDFIPGLNLVNTTAGITFAMIFVSLPFLINATVQGFESVPVKLEQTAFSLGASPIRVFFTITLPLASRAVLSGLILMFSRGISEFGAVIIITSYPKITPVVIFNRYLSGGLESAKPVALLFMFICIIFFVIYQLTNKNYKITSFTK
jgi:molybdate/tungstate transport system permease protein